MKKNINLPYGKQYIDDDDVQAVINVFNNDFLTGGQEVALFEKELAQCVNASYSVSCANGTAALHLASLAFGLGEGDWVIVPAITFLATANAVRFVGAEVYFADVDPQSGLLTIENVEDAYNKAIASGKNVKAIYTVHLNGQVADPVAIYEFAKNHELFVVEDASHAIGTRFKDKSGLINVGSCQTCDMTTFSFHPVKTITMGEGGAICCDDEALYVKLTTYRNHGMNRNPEQFDIKSQAFSKSGEVNPWYYEMNEIGFNYRVSDINCALGRSQLKKLDKYAKKREILASAYDEMVRDIPEFIEPVLKVKDCFPVLHLYAVLIDFNNAGLERSSLMNDLKGRGISTQVHYIPVNKQPYYINRYGLFELPGATSYYEKVLSLPYYQLMEVEDVAYVVDNLKDILIH
jgi:UDP-4-amino-4,6-dideoxy-N-acetyl-beta-L-altrosamine transaminase